MLDHPSPIPMKPSEFWSILWLQYQGKGVQNIWTLPDTKTYNFECSTELGSIDDTVESLVQEGKDVYFQIGLQSQKWGTHKRGKEETTIAIPGFWHDADIAGLGHKQTALPEDLDAALSLLFGFPLTPTLIVHGAADPLIPAAAGGEAAQVIPGARLLVIAGMGHDMPVGVWSEIADAISRLAGQTGG